MRQEHRGDSQAVIPNFDDRIVSLGKHGHPYVALHLRVFHRVVQQLDVLSGISMVEVWPFAPAVAAVISHASASAATISMFALVRWSPPRSTRVASLRSCSRRTTDLRCVAGVDREEDYAADSR